VARVIVEYVGAAGKFAGKYAYLPICYSKTAVQMQVEYLNPNKE